MSDNGANRASGILGIPNNILGLLGAAAVIVILLGFIESVLGFVCVAHCNEALPIFVGIHGIFVVALGCITAYLFCKANDDAFRKRFYGCCILLAISTITFAAYLDDKRSCRSQYYYSVGAFVNTVLESILVIFLFIAVLLTECCHR